MLVRCREASHLLAVSDVRTHPAVVLRAGDGVGDSSGPCGGRSPPT